MVGACLAKDIIAPPEQSEHPQSLNTVLVSFQNQRSGLFVWRLNSDGAGDIDIIDIRILACVSGPSYREVVKREPPPRSCAGGRVPIVTIANRGRQRKVHHEQARVGVDGSSGRLRGLVGNSCAPLRTPWWTTLWRGRSCRPPRSQVPGQSSASAEQEIAACRGAQSSNMTL